MHIEHIEIARGSRIATYCRNSTDKQINSLADQKTAIERIIKEYELVLVKEYVDEGISGSTISDRPDMTRLLAEAASLDIRYVLSHDVSRITRGGQEPLWKITSRLRQARVLLYCCSERLFVTEDTASIFGLGATIARSHNIQHSRDIARSMGENVSSRKSDPGRVPPYGYDRMRHDESGRAVERIRYFPDGTKASLDPETGEKRIHLKRSELLPKIKSHRVKLVPGDPKTVETVQRIFHMAKSMGLTAIADVLNQEGLPGSRGNLWSATTLRDLLKNTTYMGTLQFGRTFKAKYHRMNPVGPPQRLDYLLEGNINKGDVPREDWYIEPGWNEPLVTPEEFEAAQQAMTARYSRPTRTPRSKKYDYLLGGIAICAACGNPLYGHSKKGGNGKLYTSYMCSTKRQKGANQCSGGEVSAARLEGVAIQSARMYLDTEHNRQALIEGLKIKLAARGSRQNEERLAAVHQEKTALEARKTRLVKFMDLDDDETLKSQIAELTAEHKRLEKILAEAEREAGAQINEEEFIAKALKHFSDHILALKGGCENALKECFLALGAEVIYNHLNKEIEVKFDLFGHSAAS